MSHANFAGQSDPVVVLNAREQAPSVEQEPRVKRLTTPWVKWCGHALEACIVFGWVFFMMFGSKILQRFAEKTWMSNEMWIPAPKISAIVLMIVFMIVLATIIGTSPIMVVNILFSWMVELPNPIKLLYHFRWWRERVIASDIRDSLKIRASVRESFEQLRVSVPLSAQSLSPERRAHVLNDFNQDLRELDAMTDEAIATDIRATVECGGRTSCSLCGPGGKLMMKSLGYHLVLFALRAEEAKQQYLEARADGAPADPVCEEALTGTGFNFLEEIAAMLESIDDDDEPEDLPILFQWIRRRSKWIAKWIAKRVPRFVQARLSRETKVDAHHPNTSRRLSHH